MNIQIFGTKKSFDTKKAQRWFKERRIKFQFIDLKEKEMSKGELRSVCQAAGGIDAVLDPKAKDEDTLALVQNLAESQALTSSSKTSSSSASQSSATAAPRPWATPPRSGVRGSSASNNHTRAIPYRPRACYQRRRLLPICFTHYWQSQVRAVTNLLNRPAHTHMFRGNHEL